MARIIGRLSAQAVQRAKQPGSYPDGGGLYLHVAPGGSRSWVYRFMLAGREREMGLGSFLTVTLAEARLKAADARKLRASGIDPIEARRAQHAAALVKAAKALTFRNAAASYIAAHRAGWRNAEHAHQWEATLSSYVYPVLGDLPVGAIDTALVLHALEPIWTNKTETAARVRGRIEAVLDWAKARGYRDGENPARWRGHLDKLLPAQSKVGSLTHHPAMPVGELPGFIRTLRSEQGTAARALEFLILTAARTGEVAGAMWSEIDTATGAWNIPAARMKGAREHRVPLSEPAITILSGIKAKIGSDGFIFSARKRAKPLPQRAMRTLLERMRDDATVHGFRSTFRDWAAEETEFASEVIEMALAHTVSNKVEAAYRRSDLFEKRRKLMQQWGSYCGGACRTDNGGKERVVPL
jgi:integrase